jgi:serine/threonine protein kinase
MSNIFVENQVIAGQFRLVEKLSEAPLKSTWRAENQASEEFVVAEIFGPTLSYDQRDALLLRNHQLANLLHENIVRLYPQSDHVDQQHTVLISKFQPAAENYPTIAPFQGAWPYIRQIARAAQYAHELGYAHGFIGPDNILIDDNRRAYLRGFATPPQSTLKDEHYRSPQIKQGHAPVRQDDIFSLGQLLFTSLTGEPFQQGHAAAKLLIPSDAKKILVSMMSESPFDRPTDMSLIISTFDRLHTDNGNLTAHAEHDGGTVSSSENGTVDNTEAALSSENKLRPATNISDQSRQTSLGQEQIALSKLPREHNTISSTVVIVSLAVIVILAFLVFFILPLTNVEPSQQDTISKTETNNVQTATTSINNPVNTGSVMAPLELAKIQKRKQSAEKIASSLLRLQIELEDIGGQLWAKTAYDQVTVIGNLGDDAYRNQNYEAAIEKYSEGIVLLEASLQQVDTIFQKNLDKGNQALLEGDADKAMQAFEILVAIKPNSTELKASLKRAGNLREVIQLSATASAEEKNGDLKTALGLFQQSYKLDRKWTQAKDGVARVQTAISLGRFNDKMSDAFTALKNKEYDAARDLFNAALSLQPNSTAPNDGLQQVEIAKLQDSIESHMTAAEAHIEDENWDGAKTQYEAVLALSPGTTQAAEALKLVEIRLAIQLKLDQFINQPELMMADDQLQAAKDLTLEAARIRDRGPVLKDRIRKLSHLVSLARIPVTLNIISDKRTTVTIFRQGNFGTFEETSVTLFPGVYTVVGKRSGYRDVQQDITIKGTQRTLSVDIRCTEKVR